MQWISLFRSRRICLRYPTYTYKYHICTAADPLSLSKSSFNRAYVCRGARKWTEVFPVGRLGGEAGGGSGEESGQCIIEKGDWERAGLELPVRAHRIERIPLNAILIVPCSQVDGTYFICLYFLNINEYIAWTPKPWIRNVVSDVRNHWMCIDCRLSR